MNISGIGGFGYPMMNGYRAKTAGSNGVGKSFAQTVEVQAGSVRPSMSKSVYDSNKVGWLPSGDDTDGSKHLFSGIDGALDISYGIYRPTDFDPENPVYKVKIWADKGNGEMTELLIDPREVDPENCNFVELHAYTANLYDNGYKDAFKDMRTMESLSGTYNRLGYSTYVPNSWDEKINWAENFTFVANAYCKHPKEYMTFKAFSELFQGKKISDDNSFWLSMKYIRI